jgi:nucleotide-binding universal stress UspA family protein
MKRILVAYDGGEPAKKALATAVELAKVQGASLAVVSVVPIGAGRSPMDPWDDPAVHSTELRDAMRSLEESGVHGVELIEPFGDPAATIERVAQERNYDTIIVGSRGLAPIARFVLGSVSESVAKHAQRTVVIAR